MFTSILMIVVSSMTAGFQGGTLGFGPFVSLPVSGSAALRMGIGLLSFRMDEKVDDIEYEFDASLKWFPMVIDWNPGSSLFRFSGGLLFNASRADVQYVPESATYLGQHTYTPENIGKLTGDITMRPVSPYIGLGIGGQQKPGLGFLIDAGISFTDFSVDLGHKGGNLSPALEEQLAEDIEMEADSLEDELNQMSVYPVFAAGLFYNW